ncbi:MAG: SPOR domain-containing protein [Chitinophagaceae bacterium]
MKQLLICFVLVTGALVSFGQTTPNAVVVHKDPRIDQLLKKQIEINEYTTRDNRRTAKGFRIQVVSTRDRNEAISAKTKMLQNFPAHMSYIQYNAPFFKLKLGNFKTRTEAEQVMRQVVKFYPNGSFIVSETIEVKPEKPEEDVF